MTPSTQSFLGGMVCGIGLATACFIVALLARTEPKPRQSAERQPALSEPTGALKTRSTPVSGPARTWQEKDGLHVSL